MVHFRSTFCRFTWCSGILSLSFSPVAHWDVLLFSLNVFVVIISWHLIIYPVIVLAYIHTAMCSPSQTNKWRIYAILLLSEWVCGCRLNVSSQKINVGDKRMNFAKKEAKITSGVYVYFHDDNLLYDLSDINTIKNAKNMKANKMVRSLKRIQQRKYFSNWPCTERKIRDSIPEQGNLNDI